MIFFEGDVILNTIIKWEGDFIVDTSNSKKRKKYEYIYGSDSKDVGDDEKLESVKDTTSGSCYRHLCSGTMTLQDDVCFVCDNCNIAIEKNLYHRWLVGLADLESNDIFDDFLDYEEVYDEYGDTVPCDSPDCSSTIKFHNGQYICPNCERVMTEDEFDEYIGHD